MNASQAIRRHARAIILLAIACVAGCSAHGDLGIDAAVLNETESVTPYDTANELMTLEWTARNLSFLRAIVDGSVSSDALKEIPTLEDEAVRVTAASILAQATRQCLYSGDLRKLHEFIKHRMSHPDQRVQNAALLLVGLAGQESDLPLLEEIVKDEVEGRAENAATAISFIFSPRTTASLESLRDRVKRESLRRFISTLVDDGPVHPGFQRRVSDSCSGLLNANK